MSMCIAAMMSSSFEGMKLNMKSLFKCVLNRYKHIPTERNALSITSGLFQYLYMYAALLSSRIKTYLNIFLYKLD